MKRAIKSTGATITVKEAFATFIQEKESNGLAAATIHNYEQSFRFFCDYNNLDDNTTFDFFDDSTFIRWINHMRKEEIAPTSINHYIRDNRTFFNWAKKRDYLTIEIELKEIRAQEEQPKFFKDEDIEKLLVKPRNQDSFGEWRIWAITATVLATGARAGTICDLTLEDVDFNRKEINLGHTKNKKAQIVPMSSALENALREYTRKFNLTNYLFPNIGDDKLTPNALSHAFAKFCKDREVEQTNIHGLRHSFARTWIKQGGNVFKLQKILGHSNLTMTQRYVKLYAEDLKEDYEDFSALDTMKQKSKRTSNFKKK